VGLRSVRVRRRGQGRPGGRRRGKIGGQLLKARSGVADLQIPQGHAFELARRKAQVLVEGTSGSPDAHVLIQDQDKIGQTAQDGLVLRDGHLQGLSMGFQSNPPLMGHGCHDADHGETGRTDHAVLEQKGGPVGSGPGQDVAQVAGKGQGHEEQSGQSQLQACQDDDRQIEEAQLLVRSDGPIQPDHGQQSQRQDHRIEEPGLAEEQTRRRGFEDGLEAGAGRSWHTTRIRQRADAPWEGCQRNEEEDG